MAKATTKTSNTKVEASKKPTVSKTSGLNEKGKVMTNSSKGGKKC